MAQIFSPSSNVIAKIGIVCAILAVPALGASIYAINMVYGYKYYIPVEQPVQFSHRHHVGDDGIDCRYCHTSVEKAAQAGMPPTHTCMSCHSALWSDSPELQTVRASYVSGQPIRWNRVHDMPDFVYFNHSIHIKKGVGCETCHGRVDEKQLMWKSHTMTMSWCLDCHRQPEKYLRPRDAVFTMGWKPGLDGTTGMAPGTMGVEPKNLNQTASAQRALLQDTQLKKLIGNEGESTVGHAGANDHSGEAAKAGGEDSGEHTQSNIKPSETQLQLGLRLKKEYRVRSARELTDCGTCHR
jgi:hypothetical protein